MKVTGNNPVVLEVSVDGTLLFSFNDSASSRILSGVPGIINYNTGVKYDRFTVYSAANAFPTARMTAAPAVGSPRSQCNSTAQRPPIPTGGSQVTSGILATAQAAQAARSNMPIPLQEPISPNSR